MLIVKEPFATEWKNKDPFKEVEKISGEISREVKTRKTLRFDFCKKSYYLKLHHGISYLEAVKNLLRFRKPVLGADQEWHAINVLKNAGVDTMTPVVYGQKGLNPIKRTSFIITEDLSPVISLEDYCKNWSFQPPTVATKRQLIDRVAIMVRNMHGAGVNHRDCYICHFLLHLPFNGKNSDFKLSLIDLHRAQCRDSVPIRWRNKDLVSLFYSVKDLSLTQRDYFRFLKIYFNKPLRKILQDEKKMLSGMYIESFKIRAHSVKSGYEKINLGTLIGRGTERFCYENLSNANTCYKISSLNLCKQTQREIRYLTRLMKTGNYPNFLPKFYGGFVTNDFIGIEQEYLKSSSDTIAISVRDFLKQASENQIVDLERRFLKVKKEQLLRCIVINDMRPCNTFVLLRKYDQSIFRIVFIDGFGATELLPLAEYIPILGKRKIERNWQKFMKKYFEEKNLLLKQQKITHG